MPFSEFTMAIDGPSAKPLSKAARISSASFWILELVEAGEDRGEAVLAVEAVGEQLVTVLREDIGEVGADDVAEDDRVGDLHHGGLEVCGEEDSLLLGTRDLGGEEAVERGGVQHGRIDDLLVEDRQGLLEYGDGAVGGDEADLQGVVPVDDHGLLVVTEVALGHGRDVGLGILVPGTHGVRVLAGEVLHGLRCAAVGVALPQDRVDGGALDGVVAGAGVLLLVGGGLVREVRERVAVGLQLGDGCLELGDGCRDVRQLDDVRVRGFRDLAELCEGVVHPLLLREQIVEGGEDAGGQRDVPGLDLDAGGTGEGLDDGQQRVGRKERCLVGTRVDDFGHGQVLPCVLLLWAVNRYGAQLMPVYSHVIRWRSMSPESTGPMIRQSNGRHSLRGR
jgi:hypothetical protein